MPKYQNRSDSLVDSNSPKLSSPIKSIYGVKGFKDFIKNNASSSSSNHHNHSLTFNPNYNKKVATTASVI